MDTLIDQDVFPVATSRFHKRLQNYCQAIYYTSRGIYLKCRLESHVVSRVFSGELYTQRFRKLIYLHLFTNCFMKISPQPWERFDCVPTIVEKSS